jgi:hypothetical protein
MSEAAFSEARRIFEVLPGVGTLERAIGKLAVAGVELPRIRTWALAISEEYGILAYVRPVLGRMMASAAAVSTECNLGDARP